MTGYVMFSGLLNILFAYLIFNQSLLKNKKIILLLFLMVGTAGIISSSYPFVNELFFFLFLLLLTIKTKKESNVFLSTINVVFPLLITVLLSMLTSKLLGYFLSFDLSVTFALICSEAVLYLSLLLVSLFVKKSVLPLISENQNEKSVTVFLTLSYMLLQSFEIYVYYFGHSQMAFLTAVIVLSFLVLLYFYTESVSTSQKLKLEVEKQKIETKYMNEYAKETTKQYQSIRKFRHDYVNILSSLDYFIQLDDMKKLGDYYRDVIQPSQEAFTQGAIDLQVLENIHSEEIKSLIAVKLLLAKEQEIAVAIEVPDIIPKVLPVSGLVLIRMLGIILDNSIEEVAHITGGKINIGLFDLETHYLFIIKNSLRADTPPLHQLEVEGFSTKGVNRGLGLRNLNELSQREPQLTLETELTERAFIQKICLTKGEK